MTSHTLALPRRTSVGGPRIGALLMAGLALAGCIADTSETKDTATSSITAGQLDDADPAVALLLLGSFPNCSATLIAPKVLLTAAHCVSPRAPTAAHFGTTLDDGGRTIAVASTVAHPDFDLEALTNDIAVVLLTEPAPAAPVSYARAPLDVSLVNQPIRLVGWGVDSPGGAAGAKRAGSTHVVTETDVDFQFEANPSSTCFGDSGGAAFATIAGEEVLVGVTSSGPPNCTGGSDMRVDAYASFTLPYTPPLPSSPSGGCGTAPTVPPASPAFGPLMLLTFVAWSRRHNPKRKLTS